MIGKFFTWNLVYFYALIFPRIIEVRLILERGCAEILFGYRNFESIYKLIVFFMHFSFRSASMHRTFKLMSLLKSFVFAAFFVKNI